MLWLQSELLGQHLRSRVAVDAMLSLLARIRVMGIYHILIVTLLHRMHFELYEL